jgi:hypothetical protein
MLRRRLVEGGGFQERSNENGEGNVRAPEWGPYGSDGSLAGAGMVPRKIARSCFKIGGFAAPLVPTRTLHSPQRPLRISTACLPP